MIGKFFKKRMDINEIAGNLVGFALDQNDINLSMKEMNISLTHNRDNILFEMMFFRTFAVDFAIYFALENKKYECDLISNKYRDFIIDMMLEISLKTGHNAVEVETVE